MAASGFRVYRCNPGLHCPAGGPPAMEDKQVEKFRWKRKAEKRTRNLRQVFLRGDNIVTIQPVLQDALRNWAQLVQQWTAAGISKHAFPCPPKAGTGRRSSGPLSPIRPGQSCAVPSPPAVACSVQQDVLPLPPAHSLAGVLHPPLPAWSNSKR